MASNEQTIWSFLKAKGLSDYGVAGLMGNLYAESGLAPNNLQNTYEKSLGYTVKMVMRGDLTPIDKKCIEKGLSRAELSRRSGVPIRTLEGWSNRSRTNPNVYQLYKVAQALECHMEDLIDPAIIEAAEKKKPEA